MGLPSNNLLREISIWLVNRLSAFERGQPFTRQSVNYLLAEAAARAGLPPVHLHMLLHSCGFSLANRGYDLRLIQDYLGHDALSPGVFTLKATKLLPFWSVGHF